VQLSSQGEVTNYLYDGSNAIIEKNVSQVTNKSYVRNSNAAGGISGIIKRTVPNTPDMYYHYDALGSVVNTSSPTSAKLNSYTYDSFGNVIVQTTPATNNRTFLTKEQDKTGLVYFGKRYYNPSIGRFVTPDPSGMLDGPNLYLYCNNDPINYVDLWGLSQDKAEPWWEKLERGEYYGTGFGTEATNWYTNKYLETGNGLWIVPGTISALWMPETYQNTASVLLLAAQLNQIISAKYWQYYPAENPGYTTNYLVRGSKPPYELGEKAYKALRLDLSKGNNPGTAVRRVDIKPWEPVRGPKPVEDGTGTEYYRGWRWPEK
jgi:RHS repeat-associated protein